MRSIRSARSAAPSSSSRSDLALTVDGPIAATQWRHPPQRRPAHPGRDHQCSGRGPGAQRGWRHRPDRRPDRRPGAHRRGRRQREPDQRRQPAGGAGREAGRATDIAAIAGYTAGRRPHPGEHATPLQVTGLVSAGAGRALRIFADDLALAAGLAAPGGSITLSPYTRDGSIALVLGGRSGASAANSLTLDSAELDLLPLGGIGRLRLGRTDNPAGLTDIAGVTIAGAADLADVIGGGNARVGRLELQSRGAITQNAGTRLVVRRLAATVGDGAAISLDPGDADPADAGNRIGGLAGIQAPGGFGLRTGLVDGVTATAMEAGSAVAGDAGFSALGDAIRVGSGATITLRADDLAIAAAVRAPAGTLEILAETAGRGITLGGAAAGTLSLSGGRGAAARRRGQRGDAAAARRAGGGYAAGDRRRYRHRRPGRPAGADGAVQALELLAAGTVAGSGGAITVPVLRATVAGNLVLDNAGNSFLLNRITAGKRHHPRRRATCGWPMRWPRSAGWMRRAASPPPARCG